MLGMYQYLDVFFTNLGVACTASDVSGRKIENKNKIKGYVEQSYNPASPAIMTFQVKKGNNSFKNNLML